MVYIYLIEDKNGLKYVGSTSQILKYRLTQHRADKTRDTRYCSSQKLDLDNCEISVIEECSEDVRKEREKYHINSIDCVNELKLGFIRKEYQQDYYNRPDVKERHREYCKKYREGHREKKQQLDLIYRAKNRDKISEYKKQVRIYQNSWGGAWRHGNDLNNLLLISVDLFQ